MEMHFILQIGKDPKRSNPVENKLNVIFAIDFLFKSIDLTLKGRKSA